MAPTKSRTGRLHVILSDRLGEVTWSRSRFSRVELAERVLDAGADTIQYRRKEGRLADWIEEGREIRRLCRKVGVPMIVNDHLDLLEALDADGLHLGRDDIGIEVAREKFPEIIIGGTARTLADVQRAEQRGADYVGYGPVWKTGSKVIEDEIRGVEGLRATAQASTIPVIAIGGVTVERARLCRRAGAHGVAVIGAIASANDPGGVTEDLVAAISRPA